MIRHKPATDGLVTVDEFYQLVADGQKADLIDGVIYMASPDSFLSSDLTSFLTYLLRGYVAARRVGGKVLANRFAFVLNDLRAPEPDVAYIGPERLHLIEPNFMRGGPDIAVEVVSRDSRSRDYNEKRQLYQDAGVSEYWIIDPLQKRTEFLRLESGVYVPSQLEKDAVYRSQVLSGFWLNIDWLLADSLPNDQDCLHDILNS